MAKDLFAIRQAVENELGDLLSAGLPSMQREVAARTRKTASALRSDILGGMTQDILAKTRSRFNLPQVSGVDTAEQDRQLSSELESELALQEQQDFMKNMNLKFKSLTEVLLRRGFDLQSAQNYARQTVIDEIRRSSETDENRANISFAKKKQAIAEDYAKKGFEQEQSIDISPSIQNAMIRSLVGLGGTAGMAYYLTRPQAESNLYSQPGVLTEATSGIPLTEMLRSRQPFSLPYQGLTKRQQFGRKFAGTDIYE